ncbi:MAG: hypothetical protein ACOCZ8_05005 [Bacteroidota bacterium]
MLKTRFALHKERSLGGVLEATFAFLRQEGGAFWRTVLTISGPFLVLTYAPTLWILQRTGNLLDYSANSLFFMGLGFGVLTVCTIALVVNAYLRAYDENDNRTPAFRAVWRITLQRALPTILWMILFLGLTLLGGILIILWILPIGFLSLIPSVTVIEKANFSALGRSFSLGTENFIEVAAGVFVVGFLSFWLALPFGMLVYYFSEAITGMLTAYPDMNIMSALEGLMLTASMVYFYCVFTLLFLLLGLLYYAGVERQEGTSLGKRIEEIGTGRGYYEES